MEGRFCEDCQNELADGFGTDSSKKRNKKKKQESVKKDMFIKKRIDRRKNKGNK